MRIDHFIAVVLESEKGLALPRLSTVMRDEGTDARGIEVCGGGGQDTVTSIEEVGLAQIQQPRGGIALGRGEVLLLPGGATIIGHIDPRVLPGVATARHPAGRLIEKGQTRDIPGGAGPREQGSGQSGMKPRWSLRKKIGPGMAFCCVTTGSVMEDQDMPASVVRKRSPLT